MEFLQRARMAVEVALPALGTLSAAPIRQELAAGEEVAALIELLETAPILVEPHVVDELEKHLGTAPDTAFARVGRNAIEKYRARATA